MYKIVGIFTNYHVYILKKNLTQESEQTDSLTEIFMSNFT